MKRVSIVGAACAVMALLVLGACPLRAVVRPLGYIEQNSEMDGTPGTASFQGTSLSETAAGYIGIYADEAHSVYCLSPAQYTQFDVWIWCLPGDNGLQAAEFAVSVPPSVILLSTVQNPDITFSLGSITAGISVAYGSCHEDWTYTHHLTCMSIAENVTSAIEIVAHPSSGAYQFASCEAGNPIEPCAILNNLYLYDPWNCYDGYPPGISWVHVVSETELEAQFCEAVTEESAENLANYYVCTLNCVENIPITSIALAADQKTIAISLASPVTRGIEYFLGYIHIEDLHGNILDFRVLINFGYIPDLVISNAWAEPDSIYMDASYIDAGYRIVNSGNWTSGPFDATIRWYGGTSDTLTVANVSYDNLAAGDTLLDTIRIAVPAIQTSYNELRCYVDFLDHVTEKSDNNNLVVKKIHVYLPNLVIEYDSVVVEPEVISDGCTALSIRYQIENAGPVDAGPFSASIWLRIHVFHVEERLLTVINYPGLAAGAILVDSFTTTLPPDVVDNNSVSIAANYPRTVIESYYNDNWGGASLPNYAPRIVSIEDRPNDSGGYVTLTFYRCRSDVSYPENPIIGYDIIPEGTGAVAAAVPATQTDYYSATVPTIADSGAAGASLSVYRVRAVRLIVATGDTVYHSSCPDSGYSVNNQIATFLQSFAVSLKGLLIETTWRLADGSDGTEFLVFREKERVGGFVSLPSSGIRAEGLEYAFVDPDVEPGESYRYRIEYVEGGSWRPLFETEFVDVPALPLTLYQNLPNPFNPTTVISYYVPEAGPVRLEVFDIRGSRVAVLVDGRADKGMHSVTWKGADGKGNAAGTGIYFYRLVAGKETISRKMVLLR